MITKPAEIDRFSNTVIEFLDNMPDRTTCEVQLTASLAGYTVPACYRTPVVCDIETEHEHCLEHYRDYLRGRFER